MTEPLQLPRYAIGTLSPVGGIDTNAILIVLCDRSQPCAPPAW